ncbi:MAG: iron-containing alcohol dehydrogenase, partial [Candidatus Hydrogenedentes bacterium]|nr:iron-containing alcohol dehydrogenase [Candidatus Hydrogenedentota bacterium]
MPVYTPPLIHSGANAATLLKELTGSILAVTMELPWQLLQRQLSWRPAQVHFVANMDLETVENLHESLPPFDVIVGIGGGSCCDTAKYLAWRRNARMVLVPTIISVDAPLTNTIAVRVDGKVRYVGDIFPTEIIVDHTLIRQAPPELNRAGACDIASIHTALYDWRLAHRKTGEPFDA